MSILRSFISLNIGGESKKSIAAVQNLMKQKIDKPHNARFENPNNFHITLFFIGETEVETLKKIDADLKSELGNNFGELNFLCTEINAFPNLKNPEVLFLNCRDTENKISKIAVIIENILKKFGYVRDKNFHPHITLARVKGKIKVSGLSDIKINLSFSVSKVSIMQSIITTKGAEHKEIFAINL